MIRVVLSWVGYNPSNPLHNFIHEITEPILAPIRSIMPRIGMFDLSPMIALFALTFVLRASFSVG
ncbi:MAG: YggT family protein [Chloroflexi bacterium]|jgi:YggT family protein|nr:MAG: YggT family protein [Chloroflexota bacterium]